MLEYIILGFLMRQERSGYDLKRSMTLSTSYFFDASFGSIYPALTRLETKEAISYREIIEGGKYKKLYHINDHGRELFMQWLAEPIQLVKPRQDHLVRIFFYDYLPVEKAIPNLKAFMKQIETTANELKEQKEQAAETIKRLNRPCALATMVYGIDYYQFLLNWCTTLIQQIEEK